MITASFQYTNVNPQGFALVDEKIIEVDSRLMRGGVWVSGDKDFILQYIIPKEIIKFIPEPMWAYRASMGEIILGQFPSICLHYILLSFGYDNKDKSVRGVIYMFLHHKNKNQTLKKWMNQN